MNDVFIHLNYSSVEIHNTKCEMLLQEAFLIIKISGISDNCELLEFTVLLMPRKSFFVLPVTSPAVGESVGIVVHQSKGNLPWGCSGVPGKCLLSLLRHSEWILA